MEHDNCKYISHAVTTCTSINCPERTGGECDERVSLDESKNFEMLMSFTRYCLRHPDQRFWQALRNWSGEDFIMGAEYNEKSEHNNYTDTFYWDKNRKEPRG